MRAIKKFKKLMFTVHEIVWWTVSELEDWLYPYKDRLTPEERFEIRVKDPLIRRYVYGRGTYTTNESKEISYKTI